MKLQTRNTTTYFLAHSVIVRKITLTNEHYK